VYPCVATRVRWDEHRHISDRILYFLGVWRKFARKPNMLRPEHLLPLCPISTLFRAYMSLVNLHASYIVSHHLFTIIYRIRVTNIINNTQTIFKWVQGLYIYTSHNKDRQKELTSTMSRFPLCIRLLGKGTSFYNLSRPYCCLEGSESGSRICDDYVV
jgi:hypothetical protein